jgi:cytochrome b
MKQNEHVESIYVWDQFIRFFHWSLVSCVLLDYFVIDDGEVVHQWLGYVACVLVLARIVWGFVGSKYARFSDFFPTPSRVLKHLRHIIYGEQDMHIGHNPLGAIMMFALVALVLALGVTGFMQSLDAYWGEEWLMDLHNTMANILIILACMHVLAAIAMSFIERTNLIKAMITGVKEFYTEAKKTTCK